MTIGAQGCLARPYPAQDRHLNVVVLVMVLVDFTANNMKAAHSRHTPFLNTQHHWQAGNKLARASPIATDEGHVGWPFTGYATQRTTAQMLLTGALTSFLHLHRSLWHLA